MYNLLQTPLFIDNFNIVNSPYNDRLGFLLILQRIVVKKLIHIFDLIFEFFK